MQTYANQRVLIVDDHPVIRRTLRALFGNRGYLVFEAIDGAEAITRAQEVEPDLVVLDLVMPVMNGLDAARILKRLRPKTPLMMFTSFEGPVLDQEACAAGISAVVPKSASAELLLRHAKDLLH